MSVKPIISGFAVLALMAILAFAFVKAVDEVADTLPGAIGTFVAKTQNAYEAGKNGSR